MDIATKKITDIQLFLKLTYGIVPIVAGVDKFTNLLTNWPEYLNATLGNLLPFSGSAFMMSRDHRDRCGYPRFDKTQTRCLSCMCLPCLGSL